MVTVDEAITKVLESAVSYGTETIHINDCIGRVLAEDIFADRPFPPFDRVTMDGIAINYTSYETGQRIFPVEGTGAAGHPRVVLSDAKHCIEIMTGAPLPANTDTVIRYEDLEEVSGGFKINAEIIQGKNVHLEGSDHGSATILLPKHTVIKAIDINVLASVGKEFMEVLRLPSVAVFSSGDELVEISQIPEEHQIRKSNVYMITSRLTQLGIQSEIFHIKDDAAAIKDQLEIILRDFDVILMSGGVSMGKFDYIPEVLMKLGVEKLFYKVAQRPGKPMWFGVKENKRIFAFPGNPVSTLACFHKYFIPWLHKVNHQLYKPLKVTLLNDVTFIPDLHYMAQGALEQDDSGKWYVRVQHGNGSGDMVSPTKVDGFVELTRGKELFKRGEVYDFVHFHPVFK